MNELVLIAEDEEDTSELLKYNLQKEGYRCVTAQNGEEAITVMQSHNPDLMLLDIMLPMLNGWQVCNVLRSMGVTIPIVILTALSTKEDQIAGLSIGADDYIPKPFSVQELILRIKRLLEKEQVINSLKKKEKEGSDSLRYMVHEVRNFVQIAAGFSRLATVKEDTEKYLNIIKSSATCVESLLNDTSLMTKLENGERLSAITDVDIWEQIVWTVNSIRDSASSKEIDIHLVGESYSLIRGNIISIRQILMNILSNAVKYNRKNGKIWVFTEESDDWVTVNIKDMGYGIAEEETAKVFEKFYRAKGSEIAKGSGLGLYLVKLFMDAMGGYVGVQSKKGIGSIFTLSFRREREVSSKKINITESTK